MKSFTFVVLLVALLVTLFVPAKSEAIDQMRSGFTITTADTTWTFDPPLENVRIINTDAEAVFKVENTDASTTTWIVLPGASTTLIKGYVNQITFAPTAAEQRATVVEAKDER